MPVILSSHQRACFCYFCFMGAWGTSKKLWLVMHSWRTWCTTFRRFEKMTNTWVSQTSMIIKCWYLIVCIYKTHNESHTYSVILAANMTPTNAYSIFICIIEGIPKDARVTRTKRFSASNATKLLSSKSFITLYCYFRFTLFRIWTCWISSLFSWKSMWQD